MNGFTQGNCLTNECWSMSSFIPEVDIDFHLLRDVFTEAYVNDILCKELLEDLSKVDNSLAIWARINLFVPLNDHFFDLVLHMFLNEF